jgi:molybdopterin-binding protein
MTSVLPRRTVEEMGLRDGSSVTAHFAPEDVILAAD